MITHERLKELIEQEGSAWYIKNNKVKQGWFVKNGSYFGFRDENHISVNAKEYYETKEEAEWDREFGCIVRTEILKLPTWEEFNAIKVEYPKIKFFARVDGNYEYNIQLDRGKKIYIYGIGDRFIQAFEATKENYTLACRKAKELFLGEEE